MRTSQNNKLYPVNLSIVVREPCLEYLVILE